MITFWRILQAGGHNFLRNAWLSTAATAVMTITLILMTFSFISSSTLTATIKNETDKIDISVYLKDDVTSEQVKALQAKLRANANVGRVQYLTKAEVNANFKATADKGTQQAITVTGNPLPATMKIKVKDPNNLNAVAAVINEPSIKEIQSDAPSYSGTQKTTVDRIVHVSNFFKSTSLIASIIFVVVSVLIIFNTIRMAIFTRRSEIEIMQLVGATNWFIRGPFIIEAALYGIIAAILALFFCYSLLLVGASKLSSFIDIQSTVSLFQTHSLLVILAEVGAGVLIGIGASLFAMSRHLKL